MEAFPGRGKERKIGAQRERERERETEGEGERAGRGEMKSRILSTWTEKN